jgi:hypothetical protein
MVTFKLGPKKYQFPTRWEDVSFKMYIQILGGGSFSEIVSYITDIPRQTIRDAEIRNINQMAQALEFVNKAPNFKWVPMLGNHRIPKNPAEQSIAQFEDLQNLRSQIPAKKTSEYTLEDYKTISNLYLKAAAIYYCKAEYGKYDTEFMPEIEERLEGFSCTEVIGIGAFFLFRHRSLWSRIKTTFRNMLQPLRRTRQG